MMMMMMMMTLLARHMAISMYRGTCIMCMSIIISCIICSSWVWAACIEALASAIWLACTRVDNIRQWRPPVTTYCDGHLSMLASMHHLYPCIICVHASNVGPYRWGSWCPGTGAPHTWLCLSILYHWQSEKNERMHATSGTGIPCYWPACCMLDDGAQMRCLACLYVPIMYKSCRAIRLRSARLASTYVSCTRCASINNQS